MAGSRLAPRAMRLARLPARQTLAPSARWSSTSSTPDTTSSSSTSSAAQEIVEGKPRWAYTPPATKAPFSLARPKDPRRSVWVVNEDPKKLDRFYERFLGSPGMLPEELKWLAVTHKSFDQGRRGFNDRLAYFGRQAVVLEVTRDIISGAAAPPAEDPFGREPFRDASIAGIDNLATNQPHDLVSHEAMHQLALDVGLMEVMRWKPRLPAKLEASGVHVVLTGGIYAIIGAISLQHGAEVASRVIQDKLIKRLKLARETSR